MKRIIIIALVLIASLLASVFISLTLIGSRDAVGESVAVNNLRRMVEAQARYLTAHGEYGTLDQLVRDGFLEKGFAEDVVAKRYIYSLKVTPRSDGKPAFYSINADPREKSSYILIPTWRHFYVDPESGGIRVNGRRTATGNDPLLEEER